MAVKNYNCKYCAFENVEYCDERGETLCVNCGAVLEERGMVELLQYAENSSGCPTIVGQFVPSAGSRYANLAFGSKQSRTQVVQKGYNNIQQIAGYLHLSTQHIEAAQRIYSLSVQRSFTIGRNNMHVAACCLYIICRREKTPQLLIDFSDVLQTPVKILGQIFMKLVRLLHISIPNVDPSIYFERFANQLNIKDKIREVAATGIRIIQAMDRNWICTGRRPNGVCGAALIIAARIHGVPLSEADVANVVRTSCYTITKRLSEFKLTAIARLTRGDFERLNLTDLPQLSLPPCLKTSNPNLIVTDVTSVVPDCARSESGLSDIRSISPNDNIATSIGNYDNDLLEADKISDLDPQFYNDRAGDNISETTNNNLDNFKIECPLPTSDPMKISPNAASPKPLIEESLVPQEVVDSVKEVILLCEEEQTAIENIFDDFNSKGTFKYNLECSDEDDNIDEETDATLSEADEEEEAIFAQMILNDKERDRKAIIWDEITRDIMPKVNRRLQERQKRASNEQKRKYVKRNIQFPEASNAVESVEMALKRHGKGVVKRINYNTLYSLFT